jgi:signal peptidase I
MTLCAVLFCILAPAFVLQVLVLKGTVAVFRKHGLTWLTAIVITLLTTLLAACSMILSQLNPQSSLLTAIQVIFVLGALFGIFVLPALLIKRKLQIKTFVSVGIVAVAIVLNSVVGVGYAYTIRTYFVQAFRIPSGGMSPTLSVGDFMLVNRLVYRLVRQPDRGDIVVFRYPADTSKDFVQRIMAVGGDTVEIRNNVVFVNGKPYENDPGVHTSPEIMPAPQAPRDNFPAVRVPAGSFFVLGDNREHSLDSRFWGFVKREHIVGKPFVVYWSYDAKENRIRSERIGKRIR